MSHVVAVQSRNSLSLPPQPRYDGTGVAHYPHLTTEDIRAAVAYGAATVAHEEVVLFPGAPTPTKS